MNVNLDTPRINHNTISTVHSGYEHPHLLLEANSVVLTWQQIRRAKHHRAEGSREYASTLAFPQCSTTGVPMITGAITPSVSSSVRLA